MLFCTLARNEEIPSAVSLASSIKTYYPNAVCILGLNERSAPKKLTHLSTFDEVIPLEYCTERTIMKNVEALPAIVSTSILKGIFIQHLWNKFYTHIKLIYLKPQSKIFSPLTELETILEKENIVLVPYSLKPFNTNNYIEELSQIRKGNVDPDFFALKRNKVSNQFIAEWVDQIKDIRNLDLYDDFLLDEMFFNLAPSRFDLHILKNVGYQLSLWNMITDNLSIKLSNAGDLLIGEQPLRSVDFTSIAGMLDWSKSADIECFQAITLLIDSYKKERDMIVKDLNLDLLWGYAPIRGDN